LPRQWYSTYCAIDSRTQQADSRHARRQPKEPQSL
jgi:hypothetical protein